MSRESKKSEKTAFELKDGVLQLSDKLTLKEVDAIQHAVFSALKHFPHKTLTIDLNTLKLIDSAGVVFLDQLKLFAIKHKFSVKLEGFSEKIQKTLETFSVPDYTAKTIERTGFFERLGTKAIDLKNETITDYLYIMADLAYWTFIGIFRRTAQRKGEFVNQAITIGVNALPIISLISFLIGLVLALQSAAQLRQFGANIFIVDLVVIAMTAEMGPLLTAIMIAGRSGSAIASELASMKVAEEIDALQTMGLNPLRYLVVPKMLASIFTMPFLTLMANILGILGGMVVAYFYLDISPIAFYHRMVDSLLLRDLITGIIKSLVFAGLIVQTSTFYGLHVKGGAVGVGKYTTKAVVTSIFLVILADSILGLLFY